MYLLRYTKGRTATVGLATLSPWSYYTAASTHTTLPRATAPALSILGLSSAAPTVEPGGMIGARVGKPSWRVAQSPPMPNVNAHLHSTPPHLGSSPIVGRSRCESHDSEPARVCVLRHKRFEHREIWDGYETIGRERGGGRHGESRHRRGKELRQLAQRMCTFENPPTSWHCNYVQWALRRHQR